MKGFRKVLIAVNGSKNVLDYGLGVAKDEKTWVVVVKVIPSFEGDLHLTGIKNAGDALTSGAHEAVSAINDAAKAQGALIKTRVEKGNVPDAIVEVAEQERCDLIIMGAPKRKWFSKLLGDNAVKKVIDMAHCPVLVCSA